MSAWLLGEVLLFYFFHIMGAAGGCKANALMPKPSRPPDYWKFIYLHSKYHFDHSSSRQREQTAKCFLLSKINPPTSFPPSLAPISQPLKQTTSFSLVHPSPFPSFSPSQSLHLIPAHFNCLCVLACEHPCVRMCVPVCVPEHGYVYLLVCVSVPVCKPVCVALNLCA